MAVCTFCGRSAGEGEIRGGLCVICRATSTKSTSQMSGAGFQPPQTAEELVRQIILTTTFDVPQRTVMEVMQIVGAEVALGLNVFKDIANSWRDFVGGRSATMQNAIKDARRTCLFDLRKEASALGADAIIGVRLDFSEMPTADSGGIFFVAATGTAVKLAP